MLLTQSGILSKISHKMLEESLRYESRNLCIKQTWPWNIVMNIGRILIAQQRLCRYFALDVSS